MSPSKAVGEIAFERVELDRCNWRELDAYPDREVFQTREWLEFLRSTQGIDPVVAAVQIAGETVGYFTGGVIRRFGTRLLGSPFPGWTTAALGFNLREEVSRRAALAALPRFAWRDLGCVHLEITDRRLTAGDLEAGGFRHSEFPSFAIDLDRDEELIFREMSKSARWTIRKGVKNGVTVEEAQGEEFADEYYEQLVDVFAKQDLTPPYGPERVREMIRCMHGTGRLLLLRALGPNGERIATGIFPAMNGTAWFWGGASWRSHQRLWPNEAIIWHAIRYWRNHGMKALDTGGRGDYKRKYGVRDTMFVLGRRARLPGLVRVRDLAARYYTRTAFGGDPG
jgi:hypothetical protein